MSAILRSGSGFALVSKPIMSGASSERVFSVEGRLLVGGSLGIYYSLDALEKVMRGLSSVGGLGVGRLIQERRLVSERIRWNLVRVHIDLGGWLHEVLRSYLGGLLVLRRQGGIDWGVLVGRSVPLTELEILRLDSHLCGLWLGVNGSLGGGLGSDDGLSLLGGRRLGRDSQGLLVGLLRLVGLVQVVGIVGLGLLDRGNLLLLVVVIGRWVILRVCRSSIARVLLGLLLLLSLRRL